MVYCFFVGEDPGPCIVCGAPHTTCKGTAGNVDRQVAVPYRLRVHRVGVPEPPPPVSSVSAPFTTATYQRPPRGRRRS